VVIARNGVDADAIVAEIRDATMAATA